MRDPVPELRLSLPAGRLRGPVIYQLAIAVADALIVFIAVRERDAWRDGRVGRTIALEGVSAAVVGASILLFVRFGWALLPWSVAGAMTGRWLAWQRTSRRDS